jgi:PAS domain-containing protein
LEFEKFFESIKLKHSATIAMIHRDGAFLARFPKVEAASGTEARVTADLLRSLSTSDHSSSQMPDATDNAALLASARQMRNFPIALVATMTISAALADWREQTRLLIVVACLSASIIIAVFLLIGHLWSRERKRSEQRLAAGKQQLDTALANMTQGLCLFDADEKLVVSNARFREIYKLREDQLQPGLPFRDIAKNQIMTDDAFAVSAAEDDTRNKQDQVRRLWTAASS